MICKVICQPTGISVMTSLAWRRTVVEQAARESLVMREGKIRRVMCPPRGNKSGHNNNLQRNEAGVVCQKGLWVTTMDLMCEKDAASGGVREGDFQRTLDSTILSVGLNLNRGFIRG